MVCCFLAVLLLIGAGPVLAGGGTGDFGSVHNAKQLQALIDGILAYQLKKNNAASVQQWIDGTLSTNAGANAEWFVMGLAQSGKSYDFSTYAQSLESYLENSAAAGAVTRQKYALALIAAGRGSPFVPSTLADSTGKQGIISWVFGLHLINNGCESREYAAGDIVSELLSQRLPDGGWALAGEISDVDVTAMVIEALAPYYETDGDARNALDGALALLSERQLSGGGYSSYGLENPESSAQVIVALSSIGIDCEKDGRFSKNGSTPLDGLLKYRLEDGSFAHAQGGGTDESATFQAFNALVALKRLKQGHGPFYIFDLRPDSYPDAPEGSTAETTAADTGNHSPGAKIAPAYVFYICAAIAVTVAVVCLFLCLKKKRRS